ncbi:MAG: MBL fold metallo-hydrolase [Oceanospirillaceae bacterium]
MIFRWLNAKLPKDTTKLLQSAQFRDGKFQNTNQHPRKGKSALLSYFKRLLYQKKINSFPTSPIPIDYINKVDLYLLDDKQIHVFRLGHSTILLKLGSDFWLIDPVFSERISPFSFFGPKRFHPTPISIEQLPYIKGVLISHNHYDHLDKASIKALSKKTEFFLAPLGVDGDLIRWGVRPSQITTLDWWDSHRVKDVALTFTPAHHYSGRWIKDNSSTLWGSWVLEYAGQKIYFSGDSGYFSGFAEIGIRCGPFDLCLIETGAYDTQWPNVHMQPEQSLQAFLDLNGKVMMPIHNATFDLAFHTWYQPLQRISKLAREHNVTLMMPKFGQVTTVGVPLKLKPWWPTD